MMVTTGAAGLGLGQARLLVGLLDQGVLGGALVGRHGLVAHLLHDQGGGITVEDLVDGDHHALA